MLGAAVVVLDTSTLVVGYVFWLIIGRIGSSEITSQESLRSLDFGEDIVSNDSLPVGA
jgi:hypothetical protein